LKGQIAVCEPCLLIDGGWVNQSCPAGRRI
jgi:hypothetical protein